MWGVEWAVVLAMIGFNSVFAAYEIALASVALARLEVLVREKRPGAKAALAMKERMEASLAVVQVGITLVGAVGAAASGAGALETIAPSLERRGVTPGLAEFFAIAIVVLPLSAVTIVCGELVPKVFALRNKEWVCLRLSPAMRWFALSVWPAVWLFEKIVTAFMNWGERRWQTRLDAGEKPEAEMLQELRAIAALARTSRLIGGREEGIILNAARLSSRPVREIVLPAEHVAMLHLGNSMADSLVAAHLDMHTRFPVTACVGDPQAIVGYVNFKDIVAQLRLSPHEPSLQDILRPLMNLADGLPIASCLERMIREHAHIALVRDSSDKVLGLITLEDIIEELVGEIHDEFDRMPAHLTPAGQGWIAGGFVSLTQFRETTGIELKPLSEKPIFTLHDWIVEHLGRPPRGGDELEADCCRILVRKTRHILVQEAYVRRKESADAPRTD